MWGQSGGSEPISPQVVSVRREGKYRPPPGVSESRRNHHGVEHPTRSVSGESFTEEQFSFSNIEWMLRCY